MQQGSWLRGTVVERRSLASKLSVSCARPTADADSLWSTTVGKPSAISQQPANSTFHPVGVYK